MTGHLLPEKCYGLLPSDKQLIIIKRGEMGYYPMEQPYYSTPEIVKELNDGLGVTPAQAEAMFVGSMFGWEVPGANPAYYDETGKPVNR